MALVNMNGRSVVVPDDLARNFDAPAPLMAPQMPQPTLPGDAQVRVDPFYDGQEFAGPQEFASVTGGALPTQDAQLLPPSAPAMPREYVAAKFDNRDQTIAKSNRAYDKQQKQQAQQQAKAAKAAAQQAAARAAYDASPEGQMHQAQGMMADAFQAQDEANQQSAQIEAQAARDKYAELSKAQQESDRIAAEQKRIADEREQQRQQKQAQVDKYVADVDNFEVHDPGTLGDGSTANKFGRILAMALSGVGMALMGRGHEMNPVIGMFDEAAKRDVQLQMDKRTQLQRRADRAEAGLDKFDRISDSLDARYNASMARAYERGIRMGDLAVQKYGDQKAAANWKQQRAELLTKQAEYKDKAGAAAWDRDIQRQQLANQRSQVAQGWSRIKLDRDQFDRSKFESDRKYGLDQANLLLEAERQAQAGNRATGELLMKQGVAAPPRAVVDADGNVSIDRNTGALKNSDGQPWIIPTEKEAIEFRAKKAAADSIIDILDEIRQIRDRVGGESEWGNSPERQRLDVLKENLVGLKKAGTQGMSSDADMARIEKMLGADSPASFRSQAAKLDEGREQTVRQLNVQARNLNYTGPDITYPDPTKFSKPATTPTEDAAAKAIGFQGGKPQDLAAEFGIDPTSPTAYRDTMLKLNEAGGIPPSVKQTIDSLRGVINSDRTRPKEKDQAEALLNDIATRAESAAVRSYALGNSVNVPTQSLSREEMP